MTDTPYLDTITNIFSTVLLVILVIAFCYYLLQWGIEYDAKKDYVKKLNEHDKSIIAEYNAQGKLFKKRNKNTEEFIKAQTKLMNAKADKINEDTKSKQN